MAYLKGLPLMTPDIRNALDAAAVAWAQLLADATEARQLSGQERVASASEALLGVFEQLSGYYERSMQMLVG